MGNVYRDTWPLSGYITGTGADRRMPRRLIQDGSAAATGEFPHHAAVGWVEGGYMDSACGGALVSPGVVMTASHCLYSETECAAHAASGANVTCVAGEWPPFYKNAYDPTLRYRADIASAESAGFQAGFMSGLTVALGDVDARNLRFPHEVAIGADDSTAMSEGESLSAFQSAGAQIIKVRKVVPYPFWGTFGSDMDTFMTRAGDLVLLFLDECANTTATVKPAMLPAKYTALDAPGTTAVLSGFGKCEPNGTATYEQSCGPYLKRFAGEKYRPATLRKLSLYMMPGVRDTDCALGSTHPFYGELCAMPVGYPSVANFDIVSTGRRAMAGDSGGPLAVRTGTGDWVVVGVAATENLYTRVSAAHDWLRETIAANEIPCGHSVQFENASADDGRCLWAPTPENVYANTCNADYTYVSRARNDANDTNDTNATNATTAWIVTIALVALLGAALIKGRVRKRLTVYMAKRRAATVPLAAEDIALRF